MPIERHFVGWSAPPAHAVRRFLIPDTPAEPVNLQDTLLVVPTRQAGRVLREHLALHCAEHGSALLSARTVTPAFLLNPPATAPCANAAVIKAIWADTLLKAPAAALDGGWLPVGDQRDLRWALALGETLQALRRELSEAGLGISGVAARAAHELDEPARWNALAQLERLFLERTAQAGWADPCELLLASSRDAATILPPGVRRIVAACVPAWPPLAASMLQTLASVASIHILIAAPSEMAEAFDHLGQPRPEYWNSAVIPIADPETNLVLAPSLAGQSAAVMEALAADASAGFAPTDFAIAVADRQLSPFLIGDLATVGISVFDPSERRLVDHTVGRLLEAYGRFLLDRSYSTFAALIRQPDWLHRMAVGSAATLLAELDSFQQEHLPSSFEDLSSRLLPPDAATNCPTLQRAVAEAARLLEAFDRSAPPAAARDFLRFVYAPRLLDPKNAADRTFQQAATLADELLSEIEDGFSMGVFSSRRDAVYVLLRRVTESRYMPEPDASAEALFGWLELPWIEAPFLYVTGMNEGLVPDTRTADPFLPDRLRARLGLWTDSARLARDAYIMRHAIEIRRHRGRVCWIAGKTGPKGDPLKPSRLLFRCSEEELPGRAATLFGPGRAGPRVHAASISFRLRPSAPLERWPPPVPPTISVTAFRDYLQCPFRYYLKHVLRMEALEEEKSEPDARDFGTLLHEALAALRERPELAATPDPIPLEEYLLDILRRRLAVRYGPSPALPVLVMQRAAEERLRAAARVQADLARQGWRPVAFEVALESPLGNRLLRGRIDRIDRHSSGRLRLLDYKTSDEAVEPARAHLGRRRDDTPSFAMVDGEKTHLRWTDLQLPLYRLLVEKQPEWKGPVELGYFNLPKTTSETGLAPWEHFDDALFESAVACAQEIVGRLTAGVYWPPAPRIAHEEFDRLFFGPIQEYFEPLPPHA